MDRLVCGDVGFGKTEVAIRAAFKAVGGRQVAVLVPTTCWRNNTTTLPTEWPPFSGVALSFSKTFTGKAVIQQLYRISRYRRAQADPKERRLQESWPGHHR